MATIMEQSNRANMSCSMCGAELEYGQLRDHVCHNAAALHIPKPGSPAIDRLAGSMCSMSTSRNGPLPGKLPKFAPPARIDPFAANEAFLPPPQTAPGFHTEFSPASPARTGSSASSRFHMPPRSATTPQFRERSRSPEMRMPQDSAFPIFPTKKIREKRAQKERQRSKSMSRSQSRDRGAFRSVAEPSHASSSRSASPALSQMPPRPSTANSSTSRKGSVSSVRSRGEQLPFGSAQEPVPPLPSPHDMGGRASPRFDPVNSPFGEQSNQGTSPLAGPPIVADIEHLRMPMERSMSDRPPHAKQPSVSAAIQPLDAIGSTRKPNHDLGLNFGHGQSAPGHRDGPFPNSTPRLPDFGSSSIDKGRNGWQDAATEHDALPIRRMDTDPDESEETMKPDEDGLGSLPTFKSPESATAHVSSRSRTSTSSDGSSYSTTHSISSRSSPPTSASSFTMHDNTQKADNLDNVIGDIMGDSKPSSSIQPTLPVLPPISDSTPAPLQQRRRGPAKSFSRPNYNRPHPEQPNMAFGAPPQPSPRFGQDPPTQSSSSPRDVTFPIPDARSPPLDAAPPTQDGRSPSLPQIHPVDGSFSPMSPRTPQTPVSGKGADNNFHPPRRPTTPGIKGNCRGCGELIVGKSVSSADGRLTGRYHKHCFVCQTCKETFQTADFYVIDNHPYCQRHYHTLNGSLCNNCDRGIEGPYMETDAQKKFHPHCFTCKECHLILRNDYFEVDGVIYCEKHSRKPDLLGPGRRFPERRTTRLMMM